MCGHQLVPFGYAQDMVVVLDKVLPQILRCPQDRLAVAGLGGGGGQVEAQRVGIVFVQEVGHLHERAAAFLTALSP